MAIERDFRTDTTTVPLPEMVAAAQTAVLGDSVYEEDPATVALEAKVAELAGKPKGLYCVSGTLSNQLGVRTHLHQPPHSVALDHRAHIYTSEAGGLATLSQTMPRPVIPSKNGVYITLEDIQSSIVLLEDQHVAPTRLICLENTLAGTIMPLDEIKRISEWAHAHNILMHLDGARLWNAAAETDIPVHEWCAPFDSVSLCLSKGLCAPVGSVLVGQTDFIAKARWFRKQQGGGIRQSGWLAAAASTAIDRVFPTMKKTHAQARDLARRLSELGVSTVSPVQTNMVILNISNLDMDVFRAEAKKRDLLVWGARLVLHYWTTDEAISDLIEAIRPAIQEQVIPNKVENFAY